MKRLAVIALAAYVGTVYAANWALQTFGTFTSRLRS